MLNTGGYETCNRCQICLSGCLCNWQHRQKYDIEVQRSDNGADPHRARYHSSMLDIEYRDNSDIGRLMHDFNCTNASDMYFDLLAEKTRYLKENPKGVNEMCKVMEDLRNEGVKYPPDHWWCLFRPPYWQSLQQPVLWLRWLLSP